MFLRKVPERKNIQISNIIKWTQSSKLNLLSNFHTYAHSNPSKLPRLKTNYMLFPSVRVSENEFDVSYNRFRFHSKPNPQTSSKSMNANWKRTYNEKLKIKNIPTTIRPLSFVASCKEKRSILSLLV